QSCPDERLEPRSSPTSATLSAKSGSDGQGPLIEAVPGLGHLPLNGIWEKVGFRPIQAQSFVVVSPSEWAFSRCAASRDKKLQRLVPAGSENLKRLDVLCFLQESAMN